MLDTILETVRGLIDKLGAGAADAGPARPPVQQSSVQRVMRRPSPPSRSARLRHEPPAATPPERSREEEALPRRVISRGNNKNVFVVAAPDLDENEALRDADIVDIDTGSLETVEEKDFDPYNSGGFHRNKVWPGRR